MWTFVAQVALGYRAGALGSIFEPDPPNLAKTLTQQPTTNAGMPIPILYGTIRIRQPGLVYYSSSLFTEVGPLSNLPMYGLNMLFVLGSPPGPPTSGPQCKATLNKIWCGDQLWVPPNGALGHQQAYAPIGPMFPNIDGSSPYDLQSGGQVSFWAGANNQDLGACQLQNSTTLTTAMRDLMAADPQVGGAQNIPQYRNQIVVGLSGTGGQHADGFANIGLNSFYLGSAPQVSPISLETTTTMEIEP